MPAPTAPISIAFCVTDLDPGGAERALVQLATRIDRSRFVPAVFCLGPPAPLVGALEAAAIRTICLGATRATDWGVLVRLYRELRSYRPQIVQTFLFHANLAGRVAGRLAGARHVVSGIRVAERRARWHLWLDRLTNRLVDVNVCVSRGVAQFSLREGGLPAAKTIVIPNGVDVEAFANAPPADLQQFGIPPGAQVVLSVGRLDAQKGIPTLLAAVAPLTSRFEALHVLLVGEGPQRAELEHAIRDRGLAQRVHPAGWRSDVPHLMRAATCLALPSHWEGMPNVVLEAMAAGLPVVASRVEGTDELIVAGATGLLVAPGAADELSVALITLLSEPSRAAAMGHAGQERARREFSWEQMVHSYENLFLRLSASKGGRAT
ncbi:MAG: glycosyltransferase [Planctomycetaceae bacterium]